MQLRFYLILVALIIQAERVSTAKNCLETAPLLQAPQVVPGFNRSIIAEKTTVRVGTTGGRTSCQGLVFTTPNIPVVDGLAVDLKKAAPCKHLWPILVSEHNFWSKLGDYEFIPDLLYCMDEGRNLSVSGCFSYEFNETSPFSLYSPPTNVGYARCLSFETSGIRVTCSGNESKVLYSDYEFNDPITAVFADNTVIQLRSYSYYIICTAPCDKCYLFLDDSYGSSTRFELDMLTTWKPRDYIDGKLQKSDATPMSVGFYLLVQFFRFAFYIDSLVERLRDFYSVILIPRIIYYPLRFCALLLYTFCAIIIFCTKFKRRGTLSKSFCFSLDDPELTPEEEHLAWRDRELNRQMREAGLDCDDEADDEPIGPNRSNEEPKPDPLQGLHANFDLRDIILYIKLCHYYYPTFLQKYVWPFKEKWILSWFKGAFSFYATHWFAACLYFRRFLMFDVDVVNELIFPNCHEVIPMLNPLWFMVLISYATNVFFGPTITMCFLGPLMEEIFKKSYKLPTAYAFVLLEMVIRYYNIPQFCIVRASFTAAMHFYTIFLPIKEALFLHCVYNMTFVFSDSIVSMLSTFNVESEWLTCTEAHVRAHVLRIDPDARVNFTYSGLAGRQRVNLLIRSEIMHLAGLSYGGTPNRAYRHFIKRLEHWYPHRFSQPINVEGGLHTMLGLEDTWGTGFLNDLILLAANVYHAQTTAARGLALLTFISARSSDFSLRGITQAVLLDCLQEYLLLLQVHAPSRGDFYGMFERASEAANSACAEAKQKFHNAYRFTEKFEDENGIQVDVAYDGPIQPEGIERLGELVVGLFRSGPLRAVLQLLTFVFAMSVLYEKGNFTMANVAKLHLGVLEQSSFDTAGNVAGSVWKWLNILFYTGEEFLRTGDGNVLLRNDDEIFKLNARYSDLELESRSIFMSATYSGTIIGFSEKVKTLVVDCEKFQVVCKASLKSSVTTLIKLSKKLSLEADIQARQFAYRLAPLAIMLYGTSSIGKSTIANLLFESFRHINPISRLMLEAKGDNSEPHPLIPDGVYSRVATDEFWSCYRNCTWGVLLDDIGQAKPKGVPNFAGEINDIIRLNNNVPFAPPMADVESKGKTLVGPDIVIATTNDKGINAFHAVNTTFAVLRRFPYVITPLVKQEFSANGMIDPTRIGDSNPFDLWTFTIEKVECTPQGNVVYAPLSNNGCNVFTTNDLLEWFRKISMDHFNHQLKLGNHLSSVSNKGLCSHCKVLKVLCRNTLACQPVHVEDPPPVVLPEPDIPVSCCVQSEGFEMPWWGYFLSWVSIFGVVTSLLFWLRSLYYRVCNYVVSCYIALLSRFQLWFADFVFNWFVTPARTELAAFRVDAETVMNNAIDRAVEQGNAAITAHVLDLKAHTNLKKFLPSKKTLLLIAALSAVGFYALIQSSFNECKEPKVTPEGGVASTPFTPPSVPATTNPWKAVGSMSSHSFATREMLGAGGNFKEFQHIVTRQIAVLTCNIPGKGDMTPIRALNIYGRAWIIPRHWFQTLLDHGEVQVFGTRKHAPGMSDFTFRVDASNWTPHPTADYGVYIAPSTMGRDLTKYIPEKPPQYSEGQYPVIREDQVNWTKPDAICLMQCKVDGASAASLFQKQGIPQVATRYRYVQECDIKNGDCGTPLVRADSGACVIHAIHVGSGMIEKTLRVSTILDHCWLVSLRDRVGCISESESTLDFITKDLPGGISMNLEDLNTRAPFRFEGLGDVSRSYQIFGSLTNYVRTRFKTNFAKNLFADFWLENGYSTKRVLPRLLEEWAPRRNFLLKAGAHKEIFPPSMLKLAAQHYEKKVSELLKPENNSRIGPLEEDVVLHGIMGDQSFGGMAFSKSAGWGWNKPKKQILTSLSEGRYAVPLHVRARLEKMKTLLLNKERCGIVFKATLKDETISERKLQAGLIRVFQAVNFEGLYWIRKYFLSIVVAFQEMNFITECAVSINCESADWDKLHAHMFPKGWRCICGDFTNFDQNMSAQVLLLAWGILIDLCDKLERDGVKVFSPEDILIMRGLAEECAFPISDFFGDLIMLTGSNPSGHPLTVIINSIVNSIYIRLAWLSIFGNLDDFDKFVRLLTYGDDNVIVVAPEVQKRFTQTAISEALAKYGVIYTDASKDGVTRDFSDVVTFLKRTWRWDPEMQVYCAPLEVDSIQRSLIFGNQKSTVVEKDRLASVLKASLDAYFQHGKEAFERHRDLVIECVERFGMTSYMARSGGIPTYEYYKEERLCYKNVSNLGVPYHARQLQKQRTPSEIVTCLDIEVHIDATNQVMDFGVRYQGQTPESAIQRGAWCGHRGNNLGDDECTLPRNSLAKTNTTHFHELAPVSEDSCPSMEQSSIQYPSEGDLASFLARPVKVATYTWEEGANLGGSASNFFCPWDLFFRKTEIARKMQGYCRIRANLEVTFRWNATMTQYGSVIASYKPLWDGHGGAGEVRYSQYPYFSGGVHSCDIPTNPLIKYPGGNSSGVRGNTMDSMLCRSQRHHVEIDPQSGSSVTLKLPYMNYRDFIELLDPLDAASGYSAAALREMGTIFFDTCVPLLNTGPPGGGVTVTVWVAAKNVQMVGLTPITAQAVSEFDETVTQKPSVMASAVAKAAGLLSKVPYISRFARATEMAASYASSVLSLLGWSNPPLITPIAAVLLRQGWMVSNTQIHQADEVLAFDPKIGTTVDPSTVGACVEDEMMVSKFCATPSMIDVVTWNVNDAADQVLAALPVNPCIYYRDRILPYVYPNGGDFEDLHLPNGSTNKWHVPCRAITMTPAAYASTHFHFWRGTMVVKFRAKCSAFHVGRLRVTWDPILHKHTYQPVDHMRVTEIWDLAAGRDFQMKIPMHASTGFLNTNHWRENILHSEDISYDKWGNRSFDTAYEFLDLRHAREQTNGMVHLTAMHQLRVTGEAAEPVKIIVDISWEDMIFTGPVVATTNERNADTREYNNYTPAPDIVSFTPIACESSGLELAPTDELNTAEVRSANAASPDYYLCLIHGGEHIASLRTLMQRSNFYCALNTVASAPYHNEIVDWHLARYPVPRGHIGAGFRNKLVTYFGSGAEGRHLNMHYNTNPTTPISYFTSCFVGYRGSMVWRAQLTDNVQKAAAMVGIARAEIPAPLIQWDTSGTDVFKADRRIRELVTPDDSAGSGNTNAQLTTFAGGVAIDEKVAKAVLPMYSKLRMHGGNSVAYRVSEGPTKDTLSVDFHMDGMRIWVYQPQVQTAGQRLSVLMSVSAGSDYTPFGFVSIPEVYVPCLGTDATMQTS